MNDSDYFRKIIYAGIVISLLVLAFFLLRPILIVIVFAFILAFVFYPLHKRLARWIRSPNISALFLCLFFAALIIIPVWFLTPMLLEESLKMYQTAQGTDFTQILKEIFPSSLSSSNSFAEEAGSSIHSFVTDVSNSAVNILSDTISNFPILVLKILVMFFVFFVVLKEQDSISKYIKSILPFPEDMKERFFKASKGVTSSVIYGQVLLGVLQGLLVGLGFYIFGVNNALLLTIVAALAGVFPLIGTAVVWVPTAILLITKGNILPALGVSLFGIVAMVSDAFFKPVFISRRVSMHSAIVLIGMVGGLLFFGLIGVILGPLILAYIFIILEVYRKSNKQVPKAIRKRTR